MKKIMVVSYNKLEESTAVCVLTREEDGVVKTHNLYISNAEKIKEWGGKECYTEEDLFSVFAHLWNDLWLRYTPIRYKSELTEYNLMYPTEEWGKIERFQQVENMTHIDLSRMMSEKLFTSDNINSMISSGAIRRPTVKGGYDNPEYIAKLTLAIYDKISPIPTPEDPPKLTLGCIY